MESGIFNPLDVINRTYEVFFLFITLHCISYFASKSLKFNSPYHSPMKHIVRMDSLLYADYSWRRNCFHINSSIKVDVSAFKSLSVFWCGGIFMFESTRFGLAYDGSTTLIRLILIKPTYIEDFQFPDKSKGSN